MKPRRSIYDDFFDLQQQLAEEKRAAPMEPPPAQQHGAQMSPTKRPLAAPASPASPEARKRVRAGSEASPTRATSSDASPPDPATRASRAESEAATVGALFSGLSFALLPGGADLTRRRAEILATQLTRLGGRVESAPSDRVTVLVAAREAAAAWPRAPGQRLVSAEWITRSIAAHALGEACCARAWPWRCEAHCASPSAI